ncbi:hotdog fold thioesterase [Catenulispora sp. NF23]|uniref:Hotdog fold thioesterase n=1 Tax=Catenulispora pinistramenti TaxID=2705254 RepID=A0ABS5KT09_9ACTN|nr:hotdog fold thioesterase [Catenulispora pinistramenti]MBS2535193.1 hotdog fold thioesterase [Catenulispora pinistramenti]MBS2549191.1 hotdog fold thioesterase [Catenulispora pinistramenti]
MSIDQNSQVSEAEQIAAMFNEVGAGHLTERMDIVIASATKEEIVGTMPVAGNTQVYGLLHGGASVVLAETLGSLMAALHAGPDKQVVGVDINATHHRSAKEGRVTGTCRVLSAGRTLVVSEIVITDESGRRCCTSRITCLVKG